MDCPARPFPSTGHPRLPPPRAGRPNPPKVAEESGAAHAASNQSRLGVFLFWHHDSSRNVVTSVALLAYGTTGGLPPGPHRFAERCPPSTLGPQAWAGPLASETVNGVRGPWVSATPPAAMTLG